MLAIRMQRTGRKGHPMYRMIVQESHRQPTSGKVVAFLGSYNPHTKEVQLDKEKIEFYLKNGAQPSDRSVKVLSDEKVELPDWVKKPVNDKQKAIRNLEKLRRNQPEQPAEASEEVQAKVDESSEEPADAPEVAEVTSDGSDGEASEPATNDAENQDTAKKEAEEESKAA